MGFKQEVLCHVIDISSDYRHSSYQEVLQALVDQGFFLVDNKVLYINFELSGIEEYPTGFAEVYYLPPVGG